MTKAELLEACKDLKSGFYKAKTLCYKLRGERYEKVPTWEVVVIHRDEYGLFVDSCGSDEGVSSEDILEIGDFVLPLED